MNNANMQVYATGDRWSVYGVMSCVANGDDVALYGVLPGMTVYNTAVVVDGMGLRFDDNAHAATIIKPWLYSQPNLALQLPYHTMSGAGGREVWTYTDLQSPATLSSEVFVYIAATTASAGDYFYLNIWGRYQPTKTATGYTGEVAPYIQPVSLEGYKWPLSRR
jgi:hypothetical protein